VIRHNELLIRLFTYQSFAVCSYFTTGAAIPKAFSFSAYAEKGRSQ